MTEADIDSGFTRDVYVSLGELLPDGRWTIKAWIKPFIDWIWAGCLMMAAGGFAAIADRRYRAARRIVPASSRVATQPGSTARTAHATESIRTGEPDSPAEPGFPSKPGRAAEAAP
jgi:hypothetical protein